MHQTAELQRHEVKTHRTEKNKTKHFNNPNCSLGLNTSFTSNNSTIKNKISKDMEDVNSTTKKQNQI